MPITLLDAAAGVATDSPSIPVSIGVNAQPGDLRIVRVTASAGTSFTTPPGWTVLYNSNAASAGGPYSRRVTIFTRVLQAGDSDAATGPSGGGIANMSWSAITVRDRDSSVTLTPSTTGSTSSSRNVVAPSVSTGAGALLCWFDVTRTDGTADTGSWGVPSGMTARASSMSDFFMGYNVLLASETRTSGNSNTRTAVAATAGTWSATSLFVAAVTTVIHQGAAALAGGSSLIAGARQGHRGAATLAGTGALAVTARQAHGTAAALAGAGALAVTATRARPAAAALAGAGTLTTVAQTTGRIAAALSGAGTLTAQAGQQASAVLTGAGDLTVGTWQTHDTAAALSGTGALGVGVQQTHRITAALSGSGVLATAGTRDQPIAAALFGAGELATTGTRVKVTGAALSGAGELGVGYVLRTTIAGAYLAGTGILTARAAAAAGGGLNPSLWALDPTTDRLVPLPHALKLAVSDIANDVGAIAVDYPVFGRGFELLEQHVTDQRDLEVEIWLEGNRATRMVGRLDQRQGDDVTEGAVWSFTGTLITSRLDETVIAPQPLIGETTLGADVEVTKASVTAAQWSRLYALGYRTSEAEPDKVRVPQKVIDAVKANAVDIPKLADPKREAKFESVTPGAIMLHLLGQSWARGAVADLAVDFTRTHDSAGVAWPEVLTAKWSPGVTLLQVAQRLVELGLIEFTVTANRVLRCWRFGGRGTDLTTGPRPVTFRRGQNLLEAGRRQGVRGAGTDFYIAGGEGAYTTSSDVNARARRGRVVEVASSAGNITDPDALTAAAQRFRDAGVRGQDERSLALALGVGMPRPGRTLGVGDRVRVDTAGQLGSERIAQWSVTLDGQSIAADATAGDLIRSRAAALLKRLQDTQSGETVVGTSQPSEDRGVPAAPTGLVVGSGAFLEGQDVYASVTAGWAAVQVNTDGTATTDLDGYRVEWALASEPDKWNLGADVDAQRTSGSFTIAPATPIRVRVQARDRSGNRSDWSAVVEHLTDDDAMPPPVASAPAVSNYLGTLMIRWDGLTSDGALMTDTAADFAWCEIHVSQASNFTPDPEPGGTQVGRIYGPGEFVVTDLPYDVEQFVRLVAVDTRGNRQDPSAQGSAVPGKLVNIDLGPDAVDRANIREAAIGSAQVDLLAVNNAHIANVEMGKVTAGQIKAAMIFTSGGLISTRASGTGSGWDGDSAGLRFFNPAGTKTIDLSGVTGGALVTGEYRTAMTGERFVINPGGANPDEIRFYPSSSNQYGYMQVVTSYSDVYGYQPGVQFKAHSGRGDGYAGQLAVFPDYASLSWGATYVQTTPLLVGFAAPRFHFGINTNLGVGDNTWRLGLTDSDGFDDTTVIEYHLNVPGEPGWRSVWFNSGIRFGSNHVGAVNAASNGYVPMRASAFPVSSLRSTKQDIADLDYDGGALGALRRAPVQKWRRITEVNDLGDDAMVHIGPMVDDLPPELAIGDFEEGDVSYAIDSLIGLVHGGVNQLAELVSELTSRVERIERA